MNPDPTRPEPGDDATAAGASSDLVDTIALEAVTAVATPGPEADRWPPRGEAGDSDGESDPMVGRRLGAYRLVARIGGGEMGRVYLAEGPEQPVAVKLIERGLDGEAIVRRFRAEARVLDALGKHPQIAGLIDAGTDRGRPALFRDGVRGGTADRRVLRRPSAGRPGAAAALCPCLRRGAIRPSACGDPPRPGAGQHPGHGRRRPEADRLRDRQADRPRPRRRRDRRRPRRGGRPDAGRRGDPDAGICQSRAGPG